MADQQHLDGEDRPRLPALSERMSVVSVDAPHPATLTTEDLLAQCKLRTQRRSGPGGQHRNKTSSGVFLLHQPTDLVGEATERRSQADNRAIALRRSQKGDGCNPWGSHGSFALSLASLKNATSAFFNGRLWGAVFRLRCARAIGSHRAADHVFPIKQLVLHGAFRCQPRLVNIVRRIRVARSAEVQHATAANAVAEFING